MNYKYGNMDGWFGDEPELEQDYQELLEQKEQERAEREFHYRREED